MRRALLVLTLAAMTLTSVSCGSKKKIAELEAKNKEIQDMLNSATVKLNTCLAERDAISKHLEDLKKNNTDLMSTVGNLTTLSSKGAENIEKSLENGEKIADIDGKVDDLLYEATMFNKGAKSLRCKYCIKNAKSIFFITLFLVLIVAIIILSLYLNKK